jgi:HD-GYP domain-containing protein (c-di-GMP phosphodiesterase class II)
MAGLLESGAVRQKALSEARGMVSQILQQGPDTNKSVLTLIQDPAAEHATNVAIYSVLLAMGIGKTNLELLEDLIMAALLHDIGLTQIPPEILSVPELKRTPEQKAVYDSHVLLGIDLLNDLGLTPNKRVLTILAQQHEKFDGSGYPRKLNSFNVDDYAQIVSLADLLDTISRGRFDGTERNLGEALSVVAGIEKQTTFPQYFNPDLFKKMRKWLETGSQKPHEDEAAAKVEEAKNRLRKSA